MKFRDSLAVFAITSLLLLVLSPRTPASTLPHLVVQQGHRLPINNIAYSPDGQILASAGQDHVIRIWQSSTGLLLRTLISHRQSINALAFQPDGRILASGDEGGGIRLWNVGSGQLVDSQSLNAGRITCIAYSADGKFLAFGNDDGFRLATVGSWDDTKLYPTPRPVTCLAFSPDGRNIATGGKDRVVHVWDRTTGEEVHFLKGHDGTVNSINYSTDGRYLVSTSADNTVRLWDSHTGEMLSSFTGHADETTDAEFGPDGSTIASASLDGNVKIWRIGSPKELRTINASEQGLASLAWRPGSLFVTVGGADCAIRTYDTFTGQVLNQINSQPLSTFVDAVSSDGHTIALADGHNGIMLWDAGLAGKLRSLQSHTEAITCLAFNPKGTLLASGGDDRLVRIWQVSTGTELTTLRGHKGCVQSLAFSPDGDILATGASDGSIILWDVKAGVTMATFTGSIQHTMLTGISLPPIQVARSLVFSPDSALLASACDDAAILWNTVTGAQFATWVQNAAKVYDVALSSDGQEVATANSSGEIKIARVADRLLLGQCANLSPDSVSLSFSPDGRRIASAGTDGVIGVFGSDGSPVHTIIADDPFTGVLFHSASGKIVGASRTGVLTLWDATSYEKQASLVALGGGDWVARDEEGRFDGTKAGVDRLHWVIGNSAVPPSVLADTFRTSNLFAQALAGGPLPAASFHFPDNFHVPPAVSIVKLSHEQRAGQCVTLTVNATDRGGGIEDVRLSQNGVMIADDVLGETQSKGHLRIASKTYSVLLLPGKNTLRATAFDYEGAECSAPVVVVVDASP